MLIIDRFEGEYAVCEEEDGSLKKLPKVFLPGGCREGDCLVSLPGGAWQVDRAATAQRRQEIRRMLGDLYSRS